MSLGRTASLALLAAAATNARAVIVWYEVPNGDLSNLPNAPTRITLGEGTSTIIAAVGGPDLQDWFAITIPVGYQLSSMTLGDYDSLNQLAFVGFQAGPLFVGDYLSADSYLGYTHFGHDLVGQDLLAVMADPLVAEGAQGYTPPLGSGRYTFLVQQFDEDTLYQFDFEVTPVPAPATLGVGMGAAWAAGRHRRR